MVIAKTKNEQLKGYIQYYRSFVQEMVTVNVVLNKAFYVVIPYSALEAGATGISQTQLISKSQVEAFAQKARKALEIKINTIIGQLQRFSVSAKVLEKEDLIKLFYDLFNEGHKLDIDPTSSGINAAIVTGGTK